ncbi:hypothetical protein OROGR_032307 [Orobanche gracilis]
MGNRMGSPFSSNQRREGTEMALQKAKGIVASNPVVVFRGVCFVLGLGVINNSLLIPIVFGDRFTGIDVSNGKFSVKMVKFTGSG